MEICNIHPDNLQEWKDKIIMPWDMLEFIKQDDWLWTLQILNYNQKKYE